jgi:hypothetical protein
VEGVSEARGREKESASTRWVVRHVVKDVQSFENSESQGSNNKNQDGTTFLQRETLNAKPATRCKAIYDT